MGPITSIRDVLSALRRRLAMIILIAAVGVPAAIWYAQSKPRVYEASATIQIESPRIAADLSADQTASYAPSVQLDLIQQQLLSRNHLVDVITRLDLFAQVPSMTNRVGLLRASMTIVRLVDPAQAGRPDALPSGLTIAVRMGDPQKAADVANDFVTTIITEADRRSASRASRTLDFLIGEESRVGTAISTVDARIAAYRQANMASLPDGVTAQRDRLNRLNEQVIALDQQILQLESDRERLRAEDVSRQMALLLDQRQVLTASVADTQAAIAAAPEVERALGALSRELDGLEAEFAVVTTRRTEAAMGQLLESQNEVERYEVLETAIPPEFPVSASRRKLALAGAVAAVLFAMGLALMLEVLNPAIRTAAQLERELGVQPVIVVPHLRSRGTVRRRRWLSALLAVLAIAGGAAVGASGVLTGWIASLPFLNRAPVPVPVASRRR